MKEVHLLTKLLIKKEILKEEDKGIFEYGVKQGIVLIINILTTLAIGILKEQIDLVVVFMISLIPLRTYSGGYHFENQLVCYLSSTCTIALALELVNHIYPYPKMCIAVLLISTTIIMKLAPIEAKNKPLEPIEVIVYRRKSITILWILVLIASLLLFLDLHIYFASIVVAIGSVSIMLILGKYLT